MNLTLPPVASRLSLSPSATDELSTARETPFERLVAAANDGESEAVKAQALVAQGTRGFEAASRAQRAEHENAMGIVMNLGDGGDGAATDFEWKYVNVRRFLVDLDPSLDEEIRSAAFEPNAMTQDDLDNGRLVMVVGVAPVRPAEFVNLSISTIAANADK